MGIDNQYLPEEWWSQTPKDPASQTEKKEESGDGLPNMGQFDFIDRTVKKIGDAINKLNLTAWTDSDSKEFNEWADREDKKNKVDKKFLQSYDPRDLVCFAEQMEEELSRTTEIVSFDEALFEKMNIDPNRLEAFNQQIIDIIYDCFNNYSPNKDIKQKQQDVDVIREKLENSAVYDIFLKCQKFLPGTTWSVDVSGRGLLRFFEHIAARNGFVNPADSWKIGSTHAANYESLPKNTNTPYTQKDVDSDPDTYSPVAHQQPHQTNDEVFKKINVQYNKIAIKLTKILNELLAEKQ